MLLLRTGWLVAVFLLFLAACGSAVGGFQGKVVRVVDGDSITILKDRKQIKIRLYGLDAPEIPGQPHSKKAKQFTSNMVFGKTVMVDPVDTDRYGRTVAWVSIGGKSLNVELVKAGLAWHFKRYSSDRVLADAEISAQNGRVGLWQDPNPVPPWEFRRSKRKSQ